MAVSAADLAPVLKELYKGQRLKDLTKKDHPFYGRLQRKAMKGFGGKTYPIPVKSAGTQGISADFATAQANQSSVVYKEFLLTRVKKYGVASIQREAMQAATDDVEAFVNSQADLLDSDLERTGDSIATDMYGDGSGAIAAISSIISGVITLTDPDAARHFEKNMVLQLSSTSRSERAHV